MIREEENLALPSICPNRTLGTKDDGGKCIDIALLQSGVKSGSKKSTHASHRSLRRNIGPC